MSCTRNKNTYCDYLLEQRNNRIIKEYNLYPNGSYGKATTNCLPNLGYNPSHLPRDVLSDNPVDIESKLFGINSCNLVNKTSEIRPNLKILSFNDVFYLNREVLVPEPLIIENNQRPFPIG